MSEADLEQRIRDFQRCIEQRDRRLAEEILDDDYALVLMQPSAARFPRARWLEVLADYVVHGYEVQEHTVDVDGDCAAVLQRVVQHATVLGQDRSGLFIISDVWRRRGGIWKVWRRHSTPLAAGNMPAAA